MQATKATASATAMGSMTQTVHFSQSQSASWTHAPSGSLTAGPGFVKSVFGSEAKAA